MSFNEEKFKEYVNSCQDFNNYVGARVLEVHDGMAVMEVELHPEHYNRWGIPHGGLLCTMADTTAGIAAMSIGERRAMTATANMSYMRPASSEGKLTSRAKVVKHGGLMAFIHVEIFDGAGVLAATGEFTMVYRDQKLPGME